MNANKKLRNYKIAQSNNLDCVWHIGFAKNCDSIDETTKQHQNFICVAIDSCDVIDINCIFHGDASNITIDNECTEETKAVYIYQKCEK